MRNWTLYRGTATNLCRGPPPSQRQAASFQQGGVSALDQRFEQYRRFQNREPDRHRHSPLLGEGQPDLLEAAASGRKVGIGDRANEFIPAPSHDRVIGAQLRAEQGDQIAEQRVTRRVAFPIVHILEMVTVDIGEHQSLICAPGALDLVDKRGLPHAAPVGAGEIVKMAHAPALRAGACDQPPRLDGLWRPESDPSAACMRWAAALSRISASAASARAARGSIAAEVLARPFHLAVVFLRDPITFLRHAVPLSGDLVALLGLLVTLEGHLGPHQSRRVPVEGALDALGARELMRSLHLLITRGVGGQDHDPRRPGLAPRRAGRRQPESGRGRTRSGRCPRRSDRLSAGGLIGGGGRLIGLLPSSVPTPAHTRFPFLPDERERCPSDDSSAN